MSKYLSNSKLSSFKRTLNNEPEPDPERFRFGILHDAIITSLSQVNFLNRTVTDQYKRVTNYTQPEMRLAIEMKEAFFADPVAKQIHASSTLQETVYNDAVAFGEYNFAATCRADFRMKIARYCVDLKKTSARSKEEFVLSIDRYDYDRQAFFSMEVTETDCFLFLAQSSRKPYPVFHVMVTRDSDAGQWGREKTLLLVEQYAKQ